MSLERIIDIIPAWDRRSTGHGIHCCDMRCIVKNERGAVQFLLFTGWFTDSVSESTRKQVSAMPADLGYHSPTPRYEDQEISQHECQFLDNKPCYYEGSGLNAERPWKILREQGLEALWQYLENYHRDLFPDPSPTLGQRVIQP